MFGAAARARLLMGDMSTGGGASESEALSSNDGVAGKLGKLSALGLRWRTPLSMKSQRKWHRLRRVARRHTR